MPFGGVHICAGRTPHRSRRKLAGNCRTALGCMPHKFRLIRDKLLRNCCVCSCNASYNLRPCSRCAQCTKPAIYVDIIADADAARQSHFANCARIKLVFTKLLCCCGKPSRLNSSKSTYVQQELCAAELHASKPAIGMTCIAAFISLPLFAAFVPIYAHIASAARTHKHILSSTSNACFRSTFEI